MCLTVLVFVGECDAPVREVTPGTLTLGGKTPWSWLSLSFLCQFSFAHVSVGQDKRMRGKDVSELD